MLCISHVLRGFGAKCEAGIMTLRNALYTMAIEAWEAKSDDLVALVEDLTLRDYAPRGVGVRRAVSVFMSGLTKSAAYRCNRVVDFRVAIGVWRSRPRRV
jgi:hypothetical protein